jgi:hypothetical protein
MIFLALAVFATIIYVGANPSKPDPTSSTRNAYGVRGNSSPKLWSTVLASYENEDVENEDVENEDVDSKIRGETQIPFSRLLCKLQTELQAEKVKVEAEKSRADLLSETMEQQDSELLDMHQSISTIKEAGDEIIAGLKNESASHHQQAREFELALQFCVEELVETRAKYKELQEEHRLVTEKYRKVCTVLEDRNVLARDMLEYIHSRHPDLFPQPLTPPMTPESDTWNNSPADLMSEDILSVSGGDDQP